MAEIRPFHGVRYAGRSPADLSRLVSAPYDVITPEAQAEYYERDRFNAIRLELGEQTATDTEADNRYTRAAATYRQWRTPGRLEADTEPSLYVVRESFQSGDQQKTRTTLFTLVRLYDWDEQQVLPHECTMPRPKADRLNLLRASRVQFSPIFGLYDDCDGSVAELLAAVVEQQPIAEAMLNPPAIAAAPRLIQVWRTGNPAMIQAIAVAFAPRVIYIADGHHRYETALAYRDELRSPTTDSERPRASDYLMMSLSARDDPGVEVLATHRLLRSAGPTSYLSLAEALGPTFATRSLVAAEVDQFLREKDDSSLRVVLGRARKTDLLGIRLNADPVALEAMPASRHRSWKTLDVTCLHELLLKPHFGLTDAELAGEASVEYARDANEVIRRVGDGEFGWGFCMRPTRLEQVLEVARAGETMPPKSTYFYPKTVTGLVFFDQRQLLGV